MAMKRRVITMTLEVTVPATVGENEVEREINSALDEPPCDWGEWMVGAATIKDVRLDTYHDDEE